MYVLDCDWAFIYNCNMRVIDKINVDEFKTHLDNEIKAELRQNFDSAWNSISKEELSKFSFLYQFLWYLYFVIESLCTCFINFLWIHKHGYFKNRQAVRDKLVTNVGGEDLYVKASKAIKGVDITEYRMPYSNDDIFINRRRGIPPDAIVISATPVAMLSFKDKYVGILRMGRLMWERSNGKTSNTYYANTAYMEININDFKKTNFSLYYRNTFGKGTLLENRLFNKNFELRSSDEQDARLIFTPLVQEEFLGIKAPSEKFKWDLQYRNNKIIMKWKPTWWQDSYCSAHKVKFKDKETTFNAIYKEIKDNLLDLHTIAYVATLPMVGK